MKIFCALVAFFVAIVFWALRWDSRYIPDTFVIYLLLVSIGVYLVYKLNRIEQAIKEKNEDEDDDE